MAAEGGGAGAVAEEEGATDVEKPTTRASHPTLLSVDDVPALIADDIEDPDNNTVETPGQSAATSTTEESGLEEAALTEEEISALMPSSPMTPEQRKTARGGIRDLAENIENYE